MARTNLARRRLREVVDRRWDVRLTALVAGAGFSKTTTVLDSVVSNSGSPRGTDLWFTCEIADADGGAIARAIAAALALDLPDDDAPDRLAAAISDALWARAPEHVCLIFDDVHEIAPDSRGARLLSSLIIAMPANAHIVCTARVMPNVGAVRMVAQGTAIVIREDQLRFNEDEIAEFAALRNVEVALLVASGGWPALAELSSSFGVTGSEFVWEQILTDLPAERRHRLLVIAALGEVDDELLSAVVGEPTTVEAVVTDLPMVLRRENRVRLHSVWLEALARGVPPDALATIRLGGARHLLALGEYDAALQLSVDADAHANVIDILTAALVDHIAPLDLEMLNRWHRIVPEALRDEPVVHLLHGLADSTTDTLGAFTRLEHAISQFHGRGDIDGEVAAIGRIGRVANNLGSFDRAARHLDRLAALASAGQPVARRLLALAESLFAEPSRSVDLLASAIDDPDRDPTGGAEYWVYCRALLALGRVRELALRLRDAPQSVRAATHDAFTSLDLRCALALGDLASAQALLADVTRIDATRTAFNIASGRLSAVACLVMVGRIDEARTIFEEHERDSADRGVPLERLATIRNLSLAALCVVAGDEPHAAALLPEFGAADSDPAHLSFSYILQPRDRPQLDAARLHDDVAWRRDLAQAFVAAREQQDLDPIRRCTWPPIGALRTALFEPWIVELAVVASAAGNPLPAPYFEDLVVRYPSVLQRLTEADPTVAAAARALLADVPTEIGPEVRLNVLGPMQIDGGVAGGTATSRANDPMRRPRVRALLGHLVSHARPQRTAIAAALWPDLDREKAAANLRVTLSYAMDAFEPDRAANRPSPYIGRDGGSLRLTQAVRVDAHSFDREVAAAEAAEAAREIAAAIEHHRAACALYRGEFLADVTGSDEIDLERIHYRARFVTSALRAAELLLALPDARASADLALRALAEDRWSERAYCVAVRAHLELDEASAARELLATGREALAEIGIAEPEDLVRLEHLLTTRSR